MSNWFQAGWRRINHMMNTRLFLRENLESKGDGDSARAAAAADDRLEDHMNHASADVGLDVGHKAS